MHIVQTQHRTNLHAILLAPKRRHGPLLGAVGQALPVFGEQLRRDGDDRVRADVDGPVRLRDRVVSYEPVARIFSERVLLLAPNCEALAETPEI